MTRHTPGRLSPDDDRVAISFPPAAPTAPLHRAAFHSPLGSDGFAPAPPAETQRTLQSGVAQFANATTIEQGRQLYVRTCVVCHGTGAVSGGVTPDLRYSPAIADARTWSSIVADGGLADQGMAGFKDNFSPEEIEAIRAYVVDRARAGAKGG